MFFKGIIRFFWGFGLDSFVQTVAGAITTLAEILLFPLNVAWWSIIKKKVK